MMGLERYCGKDVIISNFDGEIFYVFVEDYVSPEDNENGEESIIVKTNQGEFIEFTEDSIVFIQDIGTA